MKRIRYDGPGHVLEVTQDDVVIHRGLVGTVSDEAAEMLLECDYADVTLFPEASSTWPKSHPKLDELATALGVAWPEDTASTLTLAEKVALLEADGYAPDGTRADIQEAPEDTQDNPEGDE